MKVNYVTHWGNVTVEGDEASILELILIISDSAYAQDIEGYKHTAKHRYQIKEQVRNAYLKVCYHPLYPKTRRKKTTFFYSFGLSFSISLTSSILSSYSSKKRLMK